MGALIEGAAVGLAVAAPVGPVSLLCMRQSFDGGLARGISTGLGAATVHAGLALAAAAGLIAVPAEGVQQEAVRLVGCGLLAFLGWRALVSAKAPAQRPSARRLLAAYASAVALAMSNPMTVLAYIGLCSALGLGVTWQGAEAGYVGLGAFAGAALWYAMLCETVCLLRWRLRPEVIRRINQACGLTMVLLAAWLCFVPWAGR